MRCAGKNKAPAEGSTGLTDMMEKNKVVDWEEEEEEEEGEEEKSEPRLKACLRRWKQPGHLKAQSQARLVPPAAAERTMSVRAGTRSSGSPRT